MRHGVSRSTPIPDTTCSSSGWLRGPTGIASRTHCCAIWVPETTMAEVFRTPSAVTAGACRQALDVYGEWQGFTAHVDHCGNSIVDVGLVVQVGGAGDLVDTMRRCLQLTAAAHGAQVYPETVILARLRDGQGHVWHADNVRRGSDGWLPNHTPHRDFVGLLYLNDVAAGGRLQF